MKLSAFLLTVNIAATLPLALQGSAQAADETSNSHAEWMKKNISSLSATSSQSQTQTPITPIIQRKLSNTGTTAIAKADQINGVKMRAFIPGRKLPSKKDLVQSSLQMQQPTMAQEQLSSLNGQVTETIRPTMRNNVAPYGQPSYVEGTPYMNTTSAPRLMPGQMQAVARQIKQQFKKQMPSADSKLEQMRASLDAQAQANEANAQDNAGNGASPSSPAWMANTKNLQVVAPEVRSAEEQAQISNMVKTINPASFEEQAAPRQGTAGPPPFPLNLLPEQSLKQLLGAKGAPPAGAAPTVNAPRKVNAPPSFFGSWHGSMPTAKAGPSSHLASSGFQSHMHSRGFAAPIHAAAKSRATMIAAKPQSKTQSKPLIAQAHKPELKISLYAPYNTAN
ncbi:MAG: hypothetical protein P4L53_19215 [Candidatus Obscuribacterales bacterium]|nr:hypothetical protein [Candidatus Obscuribacterales bacterium]